MADETDPQPEVETEPGKSWSWKLFKRKGRELYVEFDEPVRPERGATSLGPPTGPPPSPFRGASMMDVSPSLQEIIDRYPNPRQPVISGAWDDLTTEYIRRGFGASHFGASGGPMRHEIHHWDIGNIFPSEPTPPPEKPKDGKIYR